MRRSTLIRRALVGTVTTVGVGSLYLAPSLAGTPEQVAVPAPSVTPTDVTPTDYPTAYPTDTPSIDPYPTGSTVAVPSSKPTSYPSSTYRYTPPTSKPYTPPPSKPSKSSKPPKVALSKVTVTVSDQKVDTFEASWTADTNAKNYRLTGCGAKAVTVSGLSKTISFKSGDKCTDLQVQTIASGSTYKDGPKSDKVTVKPIYATPTDLTPSDNSEADDPFTFSWKAPDKATSTTKYEVTSDGKCTHKKIIDPSQPKDSSTPSVKQGTSVAVNFGDQTACIMQVRVVADDDRGASAYTTEIRIAKKKSTP